uniref:antibiotic biosynthesis monooxygenase n=1 Tax=Stappia sp. TaxID=1870903 RepID=UPI003BAA50C4
MPQTCLELVVYTVRNAEDAARARRAAMPHIRAMPGFLSWRAVRDSSGSATFADLAEWESLDHARAAAEAFARNEAFADFRAAIDGLVHMGHFETDALVKASQDVTA